MTARRIARGLVVAGVGAAAFGCAGIWREAVARSFSVMTVDLEQAVPASDANRRRVQALIDDGWIAAWQGDVGLLDAVPFSVELDDAIADQRIEDGEVVLLTDQAALFGGRLPDAGRREELLLVKAMMDDEERRGRGVSAGGAGDGIGTVADDVAGDVAGALPDLRAAVAGAGWEVETCVDRAEAGVTWARCEASRGDQHATAIVERYDTVEAAEAAASAGPGSGRSGATAVEVRVLDGAAAAALRDALTAGRAGLGELTDRDLREALEAAGWAVTGCELRRVDAERSDTCTASREDDRASVSLVRVPGSGGVARRSVDLGVASVSAGANVLSVSIDDAAASQGLLEAVMGAASDPR